MTNSEFIDLVEQMRTMQKSYFRRRTPEALEESKRLEREVDKAIHAAKHQATPLFREDGSQ